MSKNGGPMLLLEALTKWSAAQPDKVLYTYLKDDGSPLTSSTYAQAEARSSALANYLVENKSLNLKRGDRVLLVFEPSLHYILAFLACVRAGLVAVPVFPPDPRKLKKDMHMFATIVADCGAKVALTSSIYNAATKMAALKTLFASASSKAAWPDHLVWVTVDDVPPFMSPPKNGASTSSREVAAVQASDLAFLQYTSGSTSEPKGVMITHGNLAHNLACIIHELKAAKDTVVVSWLPQYHDMGLIGSYLGVMYCGGCGYYLSPFAFLKQPLVWLKTISKYRGTHMQAPNFGFALAVRRFDALKGKQREEFTNGGGGGADGNGKKLDLSSVRHMINAAEPIDADSLRAFNTTFASLGLKERVVFPTYGLAEHTVFVCSGGKQVLRVSKKALEVEGKVVIVRDESEGGSTAGGGAAAADGVSDDKDNESVLVGCGFPARARPAGVEPVDVVVVSTANDDGSSSSSSAGAGGGGGGGVDLGEDRVGEIWVTSPSKAAGYWGNKAKSDEDFGATLTSSSSSSALPPPETKMYLRTGDLGFLHGGELFVCGRLKDLIVLRGRNHYPQDLERTVEGSGGLLLRAGRSAAFAITGNGGGGNGGGGGEESVCVACELRDPKGTPLKACEELVATIRSACFNEHGVQVACVLLCRDRSIPITTSGKIARRWCKRAYDDGSFDVQHAWREATNGGGGGGGADAEGEGGGGVGGAEDDGEGGFEGAAVVEHEAMDDDALRASLVVDLCSASNFAPADLDPNVALVNLGMDSLGLAQCVEMLKQKYGCSVPDQWMYFETTTLEQVLIAVRHGGVSEEEAESGVMLELEKGNGNRLVDVCPCLLMCCPQFVLNHDNDD